MLPSSSLQPAFAAPFRRWLLPLALAVLFLAVVSPCTVQAQQQRILAPDLNSGGEFLGVDKPFTLRDLRGKIVVLDFWTLC